MKSLFKRLYPYLLTAGFTGLLGFSYSFHLPRFKMWLVVEIERVTAANTPLRILPSDISVHFFPIGISFYKLRIMPNEELQKTLSIATVDEVRADLHFFQLLSGRLRIQEVTIVRPVLALNIEQSPTPSKPLSIEDILDQALGLPVERLTILRANINATVEKPDLFIRARQFSASLSRGRRSLGLQIIAPFLAIQKTQDQTEVSFSARGGLRLTPDEFQISDLHVKKGKSIVRVNGLLEGDVTKFDFEHFNRPVKIKAQSLLDLQDLTRWAKQTFPKLTLPNSSGQIRGDLLLAQNSRGQAEVSGTVDAKDLDVEGFHIGNVETDGRFRNSVFEFSKVRFSNDAGTIDLAGTEIGLKDNISIKTEINSKGISLYQLLNNLRVPDLPLELQIQAQVPCSGALKPKPIIKCTGSMQAHGLQVWSDHQRKHPLIAAKPLSATGDVTITDKDISYSAKVKSESGSSGESSGQVGYETGFQIGYRAEKFNFSDIGSIAELRLEGQAKVEGTTQGDSHAATFSMDASGQHLWFEDYQLGNASTRVSYKNGLLSFRDIKGELGSSRYQAQVSFDIPNDKLAISGLMPTVDARDAVDAFSRKVQLPMTVTGQGAAYIKLSGPPQFTALSYDFRSTLSRGTIAGESYDKIIYNVSAQKGEVKIEQASLTKGKGEITVQGVGHPDGNIDVRLEGRDLRLEDSETVNSIASNIAGKLDFDMNLKDYVLLPDTKLDGHVSHFFAGENAMGDSEFKLKISQHTFEGEGHFLGPATTAHFIYPYDENSPFKLSLNTIDLDMTPLVASLADSTAPRSEYQAQLTSKVELEAKKGGFWNASGTVEIPKLMLRRGALQLTTQTPAMIRFRDGQMNIEKFALEGEESYVRISSRHPSTKKWDLNVEAKSDLAFLQILTPFMSELRGPISVTTQVRGDADGLDLAGSAFIEHGVVKLKEFPHAFQHVKTDVLFNRRKVIFNSITSEIGGGQLSAEGELELKGYRNFPLRVNAHLAGAELNIPEGVRTRGDADLQLTGSWFPYLLRGTYSIHGGLFSREYTTGGEGTLRQSSYLPKTVTQNVFSPLAFNISIDIANTYQLRNSMTDAQVAGQLVLLGNTSAPDMKGVVYLQKGGKVLFRDTAEFEITASNVHFEEGKMTNPTIFLTAQTRVQSFDINLLVQGTAQDPQIKLTSQPAMTQQEIISLLALGVTPVQYQTDLVRNEGREAVQSGTKIGSALLGDSPIKKEIRNKTGFNVDISSANPNKTPTFAPVDDTVSVPKITVSRQWTPKFGASASRTVGDVQLSDVKFKYQLNRSLSLVGRWETREVDPAATQTTQSTQNAGGLDSSSLFGLDLEYKLEFK